MVAARAVRCGEAVENRCGEEAAAAAVQHGGAVAKEGDREQEFERRRWPRGRPRGGRGLKGNQTVVEPM